MRALVVVSALLLPAGAWAQADDDPAFSGAPASPPSTTSPSTTPPSTTPPSTTTKPRTPPSTTSSNADDDDPAFSGAPTTTPAPDDDDPGLAPSTSPPPAPTPPAAPAPAASVATVHHRHISGEREGIKLRFGYLTFVLPDGGGPMTATQRFHAVSLDVYPISTWVRVGLSTHVAMAAQALGDKDWLATEGLTVGAQRPGARWTPYLEGGLHVGLGTRTFWLSDSMMTTHAMTMLWAFSGELGVDGRLFGSTYGSVAVGVQRTSFFSGGTLADPINVRSDTELTFKVGLGY